MLIFPSSKYQIDKCLDQGVRLSFFAIAVLCLTLALFFLLYPWKYSESIWREGGLKQKSDSTLFAYEAIGSGGLALHPRHALGWVSRLADELTLLAYSSRPDTTSKEAQMLISLKNGKEQLTLLNGQQLYLKEAQQGRGLMSSEQASPLWIKPILLENGTVLIEACRKLTSKEGKTGEEKGEFIVSPQGGVPARYSSLQQSFMKELKAARSFPQDLLIQKYGGREYATWNEKIALEFGSGASTYACFVSHGDFLLYEAGEWRVVSSDELRNDCPIAQVKSASGKGVEIEAWDKTGFSPVMVKTEAEKSARFQPKPEIMPSGIRLRSSTSVSCAFGKKRMIVRQGDWLLKTATGWRNLRRTEEIEHYLQHRLKGELFIFDAIEKEQGHLVLKGHLFDESRSQMQPLSLPIEVDKPHGKTTRKRKPLIERRAA